MRIGLIAMACLAGVAACTPLEPQVLARLGAAPALAGGTYSTGGGMTVAADLREYEGRTMVCGVWAQSPRQHYMTNFAEPKVLGSGSVYLRGAAVLRGLVFMREVAPQADYAGQEAGCVVTDRPWQAGDDEAGIEIRLPRQIVAVEGEEPDGLRISRFDPTGPGAGGG